MSQTKQANIFRGIGRGIASAGKGLKDTFVSPIAKSPRSSLEFDIRRANQSMDQYPIFNRNSEQEAGMAGLQRQADEAQTQLKDLDRVRRNRLIAGGTALPAGALAALALRGGQQDEDAQPAEGVSWWERAKDTAAGLGDRAQAVGGQAVDAIAEGGDSILDKLRGTFQEGGMLQGVGDWWRNLSPEAQKAIIYSAIAGGAGLGGYGLYKAFSGGGQPQPAYY